MDDSVPAPGMITGVLVIAMLPKGGTVGFHNGGDVSAQALQSLVRPSHNIVCINYVAHKVGLGLLPFLHDFHDCIVFVGVGYTGNYGKSLDTVVGRTFITWSLVAGAGPVKAVVRFLQPFHHPFIYTDIIYLVDYPSQSLFTFECEIVPGMQQGHLVDIAPGIRPVPSLRAFQRKIVFIHLPGFMKIFVHCRVDFAYKGIITAVKPIIMESEPAHGSKTLLREFLEPVGAGDRGVHRTIGLRPVCEFEYAFAGESP